jgi:hypothetical protein
MTSPKRNVMDVGFNSAVPSSDPVECVHEWVWHTAGHPWAKCRKCGATKTMPGPGNPNPVIQERKQNMDSIEAVKARVLKKADAQEMNAAYSGAHHDGGARRMRDQVKFYEYGQKGMVPPEWEEIAEQVSKEADSEWGEYQRLKNKFEKKR